AVDRDRLHRTAHAWGARHGLAGDRAGQWLSDPGARSALEDSACNAASGRSAQVCVSTGYQGALPSPRTERSVGRRHLATAAVRVLALGRHLLAEHRELRTAWVVSTLAAPRAKLLYTDRCFERYLLRGHERGGRGRTGAGIIFDRAHALH